MIRFLKRLLGFSVASREPEGALSAHVADSESLARFLFSDKLFARTAGRVKWRAFDPPENLELSVFRIDGMTVEGVWRLGREQAGAVRNESPRARADIEATEVRARKLDVAAAPKDDLRHANIVGWPSEKESIRLIAMELASSAKLQLPGAQP